MLDVFRSCKAINIEHNTLTPVTTLPPHIHIHIHGPFPELRYRVLELTSRAFFARRKAVRTTDKRPSSTWEKPVLSIALISKSTAKKNIAQFVSFVPISLFRWDVYRLLFISSGSAEMELKRKRYYFPDINQDGMKQDKLLST